MPTIMIVTYAARPRWSYNSEVVCAASFRRPPDATDPLDLVEHWAVPLADELAHPDACLPRPHAIEV